MKKLLIAILSLALLMGSVFGVAVSAEETDNSVTILAQNIVLEDRVSVMYAVDATIEEARAGDVKVSYYWQVDGVTTLKEAQFVEPYEDGVLNEKLVYTKNDVNYPIFYTEGVPAKDLGKIACVTAYRGDAPAADATYKNYSVVQYLYARLFKDGVAFATEGEDLIRSELYSHLLMYASAAQELLVNKDLADEDKLTPFIEYSYVYTTTVGVTINGEKQILSSSAFDATFAYEGDETIEAWTVTLITDENPEAVEIEGSTYNVSGIVKVEPVFGVHECADEDNNHACDVCGETTSECADSDDGDHLCDVCGETLESCYDTNTDGKCDECMTYIFDVESMSSSANITFVNIAASSGTSYATATDTVTLGGKRPDNHAKGTWLSLTADPTNAANTVLASNSVSASSMVEEAISDVIFTPDTQVEAGDLIVLEFDYYIDGGESGKNVFRFVYNYENDTSKLANAAYTSTSGGVAYVRLIADTDGSMKWKYDTWVRVRVVCDNTNDKIYTYLSKDGGATFDICESVTSYESGAGDIKSLGFTYTGWGVNSTQYYDNIVCVKTNASTYGISFE